MLGRAPLPRARVHADDVVCTYLISLSTSLRIPLTATELSWTLAAVPGPTVVHLLCRSAQYAHCLVRTGFAAELPFEGDQHTVRLLLNMMYADGPSSRRMYLYEQSKEQLCAAIEAAQKYEMTSILKDLDLSLGVLHACGSTTAASGNLKDCITLEEGLGLYEFSCRLELPESRKAFAEFVRGKLWEGETPDPAVFSQIPAKQVAELLLPIVHDAVSMAASVSDDESAAYEEEAEDFSTSAGTCT